MWENASIFALKMYGIFCVPLDTPTVFYLHYHGATSGGWTPDSLCEECLIEFQRILRTFICECRGTCSFKCNIYLRQAPPLRSLASYTVFHLTFNLPEFKLTRRTYHEYLYAVKSGIVPLDRLIPLTFPKLQCTYVHGNRCEALSDFTKPAQSFLTTTGVHIGRYTAITTKRLSQHCVPKRIVRVICVRNRCSNQHQTVCSFRSLPTGPNSVDKLCMCFQ